METISRIDKVRQHMASKTGVCMLDFGQFTKDSYEQKPYAVVDGIAIIPVLGALSRDPWYGDSSYCDITDQALQAATDSEVAGIMLLIDSPGGETDGAFEAYDALKLAVAEKPLWACCQTGAFSAAYLMACAAEKIFVPRVSGGVGSIGVYMIHADYSLMYEKAGVKLTLISAGDGKGQGSGLVPLSKDAKDAYQEYATALYAQFVAAVSEGRGLTVKQVEDLGAWGYMGAEKAIASGLADETGTIAEALASMRAAIDKKNSRGAARSVANAKVAGAATNLTGGSVIMAEQQEPTAANPTQAGAAQPDVRADMIRIAQMCQLAGKANRTAKYQAEKTPDQVAALLLEEQIAESAEEVNTTPKGKDQNAQQSAEGFDFVAFAKAKRNKEAK